MDNPIEERITRFIGEHHVLTLAIANNQTPWCASCFYVYLPEENLFIFSSDHETRHIRDFLQSGHTMVAGAIALETKITGKIRGIQFSGSMQELVGAKLKRGKSAYLSAFPVARLAKITLWGVEPNHIKMTDNRLGFGKKLVWNCSK